MLYGGFLSVQYVYFRYLETACSSDLNVMFLAGFVIELGATLIDTWMGRQILSKQSVADEIIKLATGSLMIVLGTCKSHKHRSSYVIPNVTNVLFLLCNINEILFVKK